MTNPLLLFFARPSTRQQGVRRPRERVRVPTEVPSTDAIFLVLRRMRTPLVVLVGIFSLSVLGLSVIPGRDGQRMSPFDAFYFISYTATTIGFGEIVPFTSVQRLWVTFSIYSTVVGWAYAIGTLLALFQDAAFREAVATQRFRRRVLRIKEPFFIVAGYGQSGRAVCAELDEAGRRMVVIDSAKDRVDKLSSDQLTADVPGIDADASLPGVLGLAGLGLPNCEGAIALTDDDTVNLAVVMAVDLLRPELPVLARCHSRHMEERMHDFSAAAVINPSDRFGGYLLLAMQRPTTFHLVSWLMSSAGMPLQARREDKHDGRWVVAAEGHFREEICHDLSRAGQEVEWVDPHEGYPDLTGATGFIAGSDSDTLNLAMAEHARLVDPEIFVVVRQHSVERRALVRALDVDSVYTPSDLVASEVLARVVTPTFWTFVEHALGQDEEWAQVALDRLTGRCGRKAPERDLVSVDRHNAPALTRWVRHHDFTLRDLVRDPEDRERLLPVVPLVVLRDGVAHHLPDDDMLLEPGDQVLVAGRAGGLAAMTPALLQETVVEYVATGREVPATLIGRLVSRRHPA
ncbi:NAD-binding protein [Arsenicicoccus sp. oral taxon 190]|uniref:NAD-binding protein n=1 Tax=Arsenicicoccus sp. oral taxon 190 TaxID=1658671 RepID=UPI00067A2798|nr:NAD-binding protein [Arsenicicoccus sp. oral taxon 190]AKT51017.1 potassium transporter [Arsenicicoccus sp. oral taxon 190]